MIIRTVLDMNYPVIDVEIEEPEPTEQFANDDFYVDILLKFDESEQSENDKVTFSDNDEPTAEDFIWSNENEVWFCQYHLTHFIRTRIMQRERYDLVLSISLDTFYSNKNYATRKI